MKKRVLIIILFIFILFIPYLVHAAVYSGGVTWKQTDGDWYAYNSSNNEPISGWILYKSHYYYCENNGKMVTGIKYVTEDSAYYFFAEHGDDIGIMQTGWRRSEDDWYYLNSDGKAKVNEWYNDSGYYYYLKDDAKVAKGVIYSASDDAYYYLDMTDVTYGEMKTLSEKLKWVEYNGDWYYLTADGKLKRNEWFTSSGGYLYYFGDDSKMSTGFKEIDGNTYYFSKKTSDDTINNVVVHIKNQTDLNNYLSTTGQNMLGDRVYFENTSTITFPENAVYYLDITSPGLAGGDYATYWYFSDKGTGNINFNGSTFLIGEKTSLFMHVTGDHNNQEIRNGKFFGSIDATLDTDGKPKANGGNINADIIHASNMTFKNLEFNNAQEVGDHILDIMGSDHITIDGLIFRGLLNNYTASQASSYDVYYKNAYKEVIQIDVSSSGSSGLSYLYKTPIFYDDLVDDAASSYITIKKSKFLPYKGSTGQDIIDKSDNITTRPFGPTIGAHMTSVNNSYSNIVITDNIFADTFCISNIGSIKYLYPIHLMQQVSYTISNNVFYTNCGYTGSNGASVDGFMGFYGSGENGNETSSNSYSNTTIDTSSYKSKVVTQDYSYGAVQTGFVDDNSYTYYFRTSNNEISSGPKASMVTGLADINNHTYFFRVTADSNGPKGSMLKGSGNNKSCITYNGSNYCADSNGYTTIEKGVISIPTIQQSVVYSGSTITPTITGFDSSTMTKSGDLSATNVGNYTITISLKDTTNTEWSDGTTTSKTLNWSITKKALVKPTITNTSLTYNGSSQGPTITNFNSSTMSKTGTSSATNVNSYSFTISLKDTSNYEWKDGTISAIVTAWSINKAVLTKPTITNTSLTYNGNYQGPTITNFDSNTMNKTGTINAMNANSYTITISLKSTSNSEWSDGTTAAFTKSWSIKKANRSAPVVTSYSGVYDGSSHTISVSGEGTLEYSTNQTSWSTTKPTRTDVGITTVYVRSKEEDNYNASSISSGTITISDTPLTSVTIPTNSMCNTLTYNGSEQTLTKTALTGYTWSNNKKTNAGSYTVTATLSNGYKWSDDSTGTKTITCSIKKAKLTKPTLTNTSFTYNGSSQGPTINNFNSSTMNKTGTTSAINAYSYSITFSIKDTTNYEWQDETITAIVKTWSINKASLSAPTVTSYNGKYDGKSHTITVSNVSIGTINYSLNQTSWSTTKPTRTDVGTTTVYVKVVGNDNYSDSSIVTSSITITESSSNSYSIKNYTVDNTNKYISKIMPGTTLTDYKKNITLSGYTVSIDTKTVNGKQIIYTGGKTKIMNGSTVVAEYTNVVSGDPSGDAIVNSADLLKIVKHLKGTAKLSGAYLKAADGNYDNKINSADLLKIVKYLKGTGTF